MAKQAKAPLKKSTVAIQYDTWIDNIVKDPAAHEPMMILSGYIGKSSIDDHIRMYYDVELSNFIEIPQEAIVYSEPLQNSEKGGSKLWVKKSAEFTYGHPAEENRPKSRFLEGELMNAYRVMGGGVESEMSANIYTGDCGWTKSCPTLGCDWTRGCTDSSQCPSKKCSEPPSEWETQPPVFCTKKGCPPKEEVNAEWYTENCGWTKSCPTMGCGWTKGCTDSSECPTNGCSKGCNETFPKILCTKKNCSSAEWYTEGCNWTLTCPTMGCDWTKGCTDSNICPTNGCSKGCNETFPKILCTKKDCGTSAEWYTENCGWTKSCPTAGCNWTKGCTDSSECPTNGCSKGCNDTFPKILCTKKDCGVAAEWYTEDCQWTKSCPTAGCNWTKSCTDSSQCPSKGCNETFPKILCTKKNC